MFTCSGYTTSLIFLKESLLVFQWALVAFRYMTMPRDSSAHLLVAPSRRCPALLFLGLFTHLCWSTSSSSFLRKCRELTWRKMYSVFTLANHLARYKILGWKFFPSEFWRHFPVDSSSHLATEKSNNILILNPLYEGHLFVIFYLGTFVIFSWFSEFWNFDVLVWIYFHTMCWVLNESFKSETHVFLFSIFSPILYSRIPIIQMLNPLD